MHTERTPDEVEAGRADAELVAGIREDYRSESSGGYVGEPPRTETAEP
jgi:hypothetical protein